MLIRIASLAVAVSLLAACGTTPVQAPASPQDQGPVGGVIAAKAGLSGGSAFYSVHIDVPPGRNDTAPNLDIKYSSRSGNDILGMGWYLDIPDSIYRCPATPAMDGYSAGVRYAKTDRLCLDGNHLVLTSGVYGRAGSTYEEEVSDDSETILVGDMDDPSSYLIVNYQSGNKGFFKAAFAPGGLSTPLYWYMSRFLDKEGNTVDYSYDRSVPGVILLSEVRYTGREVNGIATPGTRYIRFTYEARPDVSSSFLAGGEMRQTRRLAAIVVGMDADKSGTPAHETREYTFSYVQSDTTGRSLLTKMHECIVGADGVKQCLPDTRFSWEAEHLAFQAPAAYAVPDLDSKLQAQQLMDATTIMRSPYIVPGDYDGDGRRELLYYRPGVGAHLYFFNPDGSLREDVDVSKFFQSPPEFMFHSSAVDVDNDGASDLPGNVDGHLAFMSWNGTGMGAPVPTDIPYSEEMALAYVSSSRQPDVLQVEPVSAGSTDFGLYIYRNLGSRPGALHFGKRQLVSLLKSHKSGNPMHHQDFYVAGDVDGNGLTDIFIMSAAHLDSILLSRQDADGTLHFDATTPAAIGMVDRPLDGETYLADINGDGLFDIVYSDGPADGPRTWHYQLNRGGRFDAPLDTQVADTRLSGAGVTSSFVADIDNDGMEELLYPDKMLVPYCFGGKRKVGDGKTVGRYQCADDKEGVDSGWDDMSIYQFAILKFRETADGHLTPTVIHDSGIIAQANLVGAGDLQGKGLTAVFSSFTPWYADGGFRDAAGKHSACPPVYGCGLHISTNTTSAHEDGVNGAQDFMTSAIDGLGKKVFWDYYPISSAKAGFYSVVPVGTPDRYISEDQFYFTSSMYLVGDYGESSGVGDGYFAYSYQYGDERYDNSGRGMSGFRYDIEHDISSKYKRISIYDQRFPLDGRVLAEWKVKEDIVDDGLKAGVPPADHGYYLSDTWDCTAPKGFAKAEGPQCVDSGGPVYGYFLRHKTDHDWDSDLGAWTDMDVRYDYDADGREIHRVTKTSGPKKVETEDVSTRYAPRDVQHWIVGRKIGEKTRKITEPVPAATGVPAAVAAAKDAPVKTQTDEDDTYAYDDRGRTHRVVQDGPDPYVEMRVLTYVEDPAADDYGRLASVSLTRAAKEDAPPDFLRNMRFTHDTGGYFDTSVTSAGMDPETSAYDPATGDLLNDTKDGVTQTFRYDILGRPVHYEKTEKDKDPFVWDASYGRCYPKMCGADAVYFVTETFDNRYSITTFYDKRGKRMNHPKDSLLKDD